MSLKLSAARRARLWKLLIDSIELYLAKVNDLPVSPELDPDAIRAFLAQFDFTEPVAPDTAVAQAAEGLTRWQVHTPHPRYFGLFNPAPTTMGIAADALTATFNPQMAAWSHNPFAAEVERHLIRALGSKFGYRECDGTFCSGGMEANHTAVLAALTAALPDFPAQGLRSARGWPVLYVSSEGHHSFLKSARLCGLGTAAVREIEVDNRLRMRVDALEEAIARDRKDGMLPFLIVGTAGTTSGGAVDPLGDLADLAEREGLWFHVDAAWGGAAALVPELRPILAGIERSRSITFDAHKWLSVPMGAGVYITQDREILDRTFRVATAYMPKDAVGLDVTDPHLHSMQWSRRFIGLKVFLSLLVAGWSGYEEAIRHQTAMGTLLRERLASAGWEIVNDTPLPVVCFADRSGDPETQKTIANHVVRSGQAWISPTVVGGRTVIRACITHYDTQPGDLDALIAALDTARRAQPATS